MANKDAPRGLLPKEHLDGSSYNGLARRYVFLAATGTDTFVGDAVKSNGSGDDEGVPDIVQAAAGDTLRGVIVDFEPDVLTPDLLYRKASTLRYALVVDSPDVIFEIQEDSDGGALAKGDIGNNADLIVAAGDTTTGYSKMELDSSTKVTTTAQLRILRKSQRAKNDIGNQCAWDVVINEHELKSTTGT